MTARSVIVGTVAACAVSAGAWWGLTPTVAPMPAHAGPAWPDRNPITCTVTRSGVVKCVIPTQGRDAVVLVRVWEDGSGRCTVLDPDASPWRGGKKARG